MTCTGHFSIIIICRHNSKQCWKGPIEYHEDTQEQYFRVTFYCHWNIPDNTKINGPLLSTTLFTRVTQHVHGKHSDSSYTSILQCRANTFCSSLLLHGYECNLFYFIGTSIPNNILFRWHVNNLYFRPANILPR